MESGLRDELYFRRRRYGGGGSDLPWATFTGNPLEFDAPKAHALKSCTVAIEPIQDLHGQSSPYPAGGGDNKYSDVWSDYTKPNDYRIMPISLDSGYWRLYATKVGNTVTDCTVGIAKDGTRYTNFVDPLFVISNRGAVSDVTLNVDATWTNPVLIIYCADETAFNSIFANYNVSLTQGGGKPAYTPYSNICPISGTTECKVWRTGKNLYPYADYPVYTWDFAANTTFADATRPILFKANTDYTLSLPVGEKLYRMRFFDRDKNVIDPSGKVTTFSSGQSNGITYYDSYKFCNYNNASAADNVLIIKFKEDVWMDACVQTTAITQVMLNLGSTAEPYEAYSGTSVTVALGQTVYGGTLDVTTGVLTVTWAKRHLVASEFDTYYQSYKQAYASGLLASAPAKYAADEISYMCDLFAPCPNTARGTRIGNYATLIESGASCAFSSPAETLEDFKASIPNGIDLVYELATPLTYNLTALQVIDALQGRNVMWTDASDLTVEARGTAVNLNALQSLNILLGNRYVNNHTADDVSDDEALSILLGK